MVLGWLCTYIFYNNIPTKVLTMNRLNVFKDSHLVHFLASHCKANLMKSNITWDISAIVTLVILLAARDLYWLSHPISTCMYMCILSYIYIDRKWLSLVCFKIRMFDLLSAWRRLHDPVLKFPNLGQIVTLSAMH